MHRGTGHTTVYQQPRASGHVPLEPYDVPSRRLPGANPADQKGTLHSFHNKHLPVVVLSQGCPFLNTAAWPIRSLELRSVRRHDDVQRQNSKTLPRPSPSLVRSILALLRSAPVFSPSSQGHTYRPRRRISTYHRRERADPGAHRMIYRPSSSATPAGA